MMVFNMTHISRILSSIAILSAVTVISACFDIPSEPKTGQGVTSISVYVTQNDKIDSTLLKIHPQDSAEIHTSVYPADHSGKLQFKWYKANEGMGDVLLGTGSTYKISKNSSTDLIPNKLVTMDTEGNSMVSHFNIITNTPPEIDKIINPQPSDTLYGNENTSFLFEWSTHDNENEDFSHVVLIDSVAYVVGDFNSIRQSGFEDGEHTFQVIVTDSYGDSDSSDVIDFYVTSIRSPRE